MHSAFGVAYWRRRAAAERGESPWSAAAGVGEQAAFAEWVAGLRARHSLKNDDVTLMVIEVRDAVASAV